MTDGSMITPPTPTPTPQPHEPPEAITRGEVETALKALQSSLDAMQASINDMRQHATGSVAALDEKLAARIEAERLARETALKLMQEEIAHTTDAKITAMGQKLDGLTHSLTGELRGIRDMLTAWNTTLENVTTTQRNLATQHREQQRAIDEQRGMISDVKDRHSATRPILASIQEQLRETRVTLLGGDDDRTSIIQTVTDMQRAASTETVANQHAFHQITELINRQLASSDNLAEQLAAVTKRLDARDEREARMIATIKELIKGALVNRWVLGGLVASGLGILAGASPEFVDWIIGLLGG
jgi:DNA repair exonuclease SbcCD ATPase subunit